MIKPNALLPPSYRPLYSMVSNGEMWVFDWKCIASSHSKSDMYIVENVNDLFVVINYCFVVIVFPKAVNKQHPSNEELLSMAEFFKGEFLGFDHLPRYHLVSDVSLHLGLLQELVT